VGELEMVLVMEKPVPEVRTNFGVCLGAVTREATVNTSAARTSAAALALTTVFACLSLVISSAH
jgi:hypothetical protein